MHFRLCQNLSLIILAPLCGVAIKAVGSKADPLLFLYIRSTEEPFLCLHHAPADVPGSWKHIFESAGYEGICQLRRLGALKEIQGYL